MRRKDPRGRKPAAASIRANWIGPRGLTVRFAISEDLIEELRRMHMEVYAFAYGMQIGGPKSDPLRRPRMQFMRFDDMRMNAVMLCIEPPSYDPRGQRMRRDPKGRKWYVEVPARAIGVHPNMLPCDVEYLFDKDQPRLLGGGMVLVLPDRVMNYPKPPAPARRRQRPEPAPEPAPDKPRPQPAPAPATDWRKRWGDYAVDESETP